MRLTSSTSWIPQSWFLLGRQKMSQTYCEKYATTTKTFRSDYCAAYFLRRTMGEARPELVRPERACCKITSGV